MRHCTSGLRELWCFLTHSGVVDMSCVSVSSSREHSSLCCCCCSMSMLSSSSPVVVDSSWSVSPVTLPSVSSLLSTPTRSEAESITQSKPNWEPSFTSCSRLSAADWTTSDVSSNCCLAVSLLSHELSPTPLRHSPFVGFTASTTGRLLGFFCGNIVVRRFRFSVDSVAVTDRWRLFAERFPSDFRCPSEFVRFLLFPFVVLSTLSVSSPNLVTENKKWNLH